MKLFKRDVDFLINNISHPSIMEELLDARGVLDLSENSTKQKAEANFSSDELSTIVDVLGDLLCSKGISDGEVNAFGQHIESLIDTFSNELEH